MLIPKITALGQQNRTLAETRAVLSALVTQLDELTSEYLVSARIQDVVDLIDRRLAEEAR
ncbi:MAG: hypothetical protein ABW048_06120 [Sphingobium sp.]